MTHFLGMSLFLLLTSKRDDFMGQVEVDFKQLLEKEGEEVRQTYLLKNSVVHKASSVHGSLELAGTYFS